MLLLPDDDGCAGGSDGRTVKQTGAVSEASVTALRIYKSVISPLIPKACRFIPTCSEYGAVAFERYPPWQAATLTAWRLLRCNPLHVKGCGCGGDEPVWPPVAYWAGDGRIRTFLDDELSRKRANGEPVDDDIVAFGGADPLGLAQRQRRDDSRRSGGVSMSAATPASVLSGCRLTYFGIPGRAEAIRLALALGGVDFEDERVPFPAWGKVKPSTPWGTVPVLELADGSKLAQARSVLRFVGRHVGLYPADPLAAQRVDELMDALEDLGASVASVGQGLPKEEQEAARRAAVSEGGAIHAALARIDAFIAAHGSGGHAVGAEMTVASILTFTSLGRLVGGVYYGVPATACDSFAHLQAVRRTVGGHPAVVAWYDARLAQQQSVGAALSPAEQVLAGCRDM